MLCMKYIYDRKNNIIIITIFFRNATHMIPNSECLADVTFCSSIESDRSRHTCAKLWDY